MQFIRIFCTNDCMVQPKHSMIAIFSALLTKTVIKIGSFIFYLYFCTVFQEKTLCQREKY